MSVPKSSHLYAQVIVDIPHSDLDRAFHYTVPTGLEETVEVGREIWVSFNRRITRGWVVGIEKHLPSTLCPTTIYEIDAVDESYTLGRDLIALVPWLADQVMCTQADVLRVMAPPGQRTKPVVVISLREKITKEQMEIWQGIDPDSGDILRRLSRAPRHEIKKSSLLSLQKERMSIAIERLLAAGLIEQKGCLRVNLKSQLLNDEPIESDEQDRSAIAVVEPVLTFQQQKVVDELLNAMDEGSQRPFLLHGVTGSGKTEVYIRAAKKALEMGRQVLFLVPEIALTPQTGKRLTERFGKTDVVVLHSGLPDALRRQEWFRIARGYVRIVIGARSAVFAPLPNLGLIIVDEEHEPSYQQENAPKYHARQVAIERARRCNGVVILGSATPSLETYQKARAGEYRLLQLNSRASGKAMPQINIVDMRAELATGNRGMISGVLLNAIERRLQLGQQVILYLNRRGFSTFVICRECGTVLNCPHCSISLVYHRVGEQLHCHYCHYRQSVPKQCPNCLSQAIRFFGTGTQRIETELTERLPGVRVIRMDRDVADGIGVETVLEEFAASDGSNANILVGTQMIAKGLDFPLVTLVGVLAADASLHVSDYRAAERTFQLLLQVAGRAGRSHLTGEVILQSYCPEHYCLQAVQNHDYEAFYERETEIRRKLAYPPFTRLARVMFSGAGESAVIMAAETWAEILKKESKHLNLDVWGPAPAAVAKVEGRFRWLITTRIGSTDSLPMRIALKAAEREYASRRGCPPGVSISITIDPTGI